MNHYIPGKLEPLASTVKFNFTLNGESHAAYFIVDGDTIEVALAEPWAWVSARDAFNLAKQYAVEHRADVLDAAAGHAAQPHRGPLNIIMTPSGPLPVFDERDVE